MPGTVLTWIEYFFPSRGQVWASGRRYRNPIIQVGYTLALYAAIVFLIVLAIFGHHQGR